MSHNIQGFIFNKRETAERFSHFENAHLIDMEQGFVFIPLTNALADEIGGKEDSPYEVFWKFNPNIEALLVDNSKDGMITYLETDYWGGDGEQAAAIWYKGILYFGPKHSKIGAISRCLKLMKAVKNDMYDEFEAIGLTKFRSNDDWIEHANALKN
ncbi:MAG: hypothetical protein AAF502_17330 [Bacteroidota bacterium]